MAYITYPGTKATRDFPLTDSAQAIFANTQVFRVAAGVTIAPDELLVFSGTGPLIVAPATTGMPVIGTDKIAGTSVTYSTATASAAGEVIVLTPDPLRRYNVKLGTAVANEAAALALIGDQCLVTTTTVNGYSHQVLDNTANAPENGIQIMAVDVDSDIAEVQLLTFTDTLPA